MRTPRFRQLHKYFCVVGLVLVAAAVAACAAPTEELTATAAVPTAEPPSPTAAPTDTPAPTNTPEPDLRITAASLPNLTELSSFQAADAPLVAGALAPDSHNIATFDAERNVRIWDADRGQSLFELGQHSAEGFGLAYSPDGTMVASGGGFEVKFWDAGTGKLVSSVTTDVFVFRLVWSPDGKLVAAVGDSSSHIPIVDVATAKLVDLLDTPAGNVLWAAAFSPDSTMVAAGDYEGQITVIKLSDKTVVAHSREGRGATWDIEFSPDGALLVSCNSGGHIYAWDTQTWTLNSNMTKPEAHNVQASCADGVFTPDGSLYFSAGLDGRLIAWDVATGAALAERDYGVPIWTASLSGDDSRLALAMDDGQLRLLGLGEGPAPEAPTPAVTPTPEGVLEIDDVPTYPGITRTVATDALEIPKKCGGTIFRHFDVYYSIDYGAELTKEEKKASPLNQQIVDWYKAQFAAQDWLVFDTPEPVNALFESVFWEEEDRSYPAGAEDPPYVGSCYLATILVQPPGAELEIIADVE